MKIEPERRLIGYARVSTDDQDLTLQREALMRYGVKREHIFEEHASGKTMKRVMLSRALRSMREHDTIVVWKLDRLGRTLPGVLEVLQQIKDEGVHFVSITESFDTGSPIGQAMLQICMVFAELERNMISERTKAGIMEAKKRGAKFGQPNKITDVPKRLAYLQQLEAEGKLRDEDGDLRMRADDLRAELNKAKYGGGAIKSAETVRRWVRMGYPKLVPGADVVRDEPLDLKEHKRWTAKENF
ncbi:MAG: recombinase family protein [Erythrobacter sp.]|jgi:DNA invertase Pin-like site-specific DNA recombinase|nr:recombinase family protein [Erythrobacter sp.]